MHSFTTERLLIRPLNEQDKDLYISLYTDVKIMRNIGEPLSTKAAEQAFNRSLKAMTIDSPIILTWAIVTLSNYNSIGIQALNLKTPDTADIGIMLLRTSNGKLLPEEAMGALMEYSFNYLPIITINAYYAKANLATKRFVKKLGFNYNDSQQPENSNSAYQYFNKNRWCKSLIHNVL